MKFNIWLLAIFFILFSVSGCASIIKGSGPQGIYFKSEPPEAQVRVIDLRNGNVVADAKTPNPVLLKKGAGYFKYAKYNVEISKEGYDKKYVKIEGDASGWYIGGNLLFGGLIGYLIVDPATGAMWTLNPEEVNVLLQLTGGTDPIGFNVDEFTPPLSVEKLCAAINADKYDIQFTEPDNTIKRLNEILEIPELYENLRSKDKLPKKDGEISLPPNIKDLRKEITDGRYEFVKFVTLSFDQQSKVRKVNRGLLEIAYPNEAPKK